MNAQQSSSISVLLQYQRNGSATWDSIELTPDCYFDLDSGDTPTMDAVPKYDHAVNYIQEDNKTITKTRLVISQAEQSRTITESFWNEGRNRLIERHDEGPSNEYRELIQELRIQEHPPTWRILRFVWVQGVLSVITDVMIAERSDGSQIETRLPL